MDHFLLISNVCTLPWAKTPNGCALADPPVFLTKARIMNRFSITLVSRFALLFVLSLSSSPIIADKAQPAGGVKISQSYWAGISILPLHYQEKSSAQTPQPAKIDVDKELALIEAVKAHIDNDKSFEALRRSKLKYPNNHNDSAKAEIFEFKESLPPPTI